MMIRCCAVCALAVTILAAITRGDEARLRQVYQAYQGAPDKLAYVLEQSNSEDEEVLVWAVRTLGSYQTPSAREALQRLRTYRQRNKEFPSIAAEARDSLLRLDLEPELRQLAADDVSETARMGIVRKYARPSAESNYPREQILRYLLARADQAPDPNVALLVEFYADDHRALPFVQRHPQIARRGLPAAISSPYPDVVAGAVALVARLRAVELLDEIVPFAFADRGGIGNASVRLSLMTTVVAMGDESTPQLRRILRSNNSLAQLDAMIALERIGTPAAIQALRQFAEVYLERQPSWQDKAVATQARRAMGNAASRRIGADVGK